MGQVLDVAERNEAQAVVREDQERAVIEDASDDAPLAGCELAGPVDVGIAEMRGPGVGFEK
jgi:hypothetical protein